MKFAIKDAPIQKLHSLWNHLHYQYTMVRWVYILSLTPPLHVSPRHARIKGHQNTKRQHIPSMLTPSSSIERTTKNFPDIPRLPGTITSLRNFARSLIFPLVHFPWLEITYNLKRKKFNKGKLWMKQYMVSGSTISGGIVPVDRHPKWLEARPV